MVAASPQLRLHEVKRTFLELRRVFEPSRILTPRLSDLEGDVRKIADVLDEAYEILRDSARRERYRRANGSAPRPPREAFGPRGARA